MNALAFIIAYMRRGCQSKTVFYFCTKKDRFGEAILSISIRKKRAERHIQARARTECSAAAARRQRGYGFPCRSENGGNSDISDRYILNGLSAEREKLPFHIYDTIFPDFGQRTNFTFGGQSAPAASECPNSLSVRIKGAPARRIAPPKMSTYCGVIDKISTFI